MSLAYLSLGSNLGEREKYLEAARSAIRGAFSGSRFSQVYETEPVDLKDQPWFLNQVAEVPTELTPESLLEWCLAFEVGLGRRRDVPKGPRSLDLDLLLYGGRTMDSEGLILPHPRLHLRRHVLVPLEELAPDQVIPGTGWTVREALKRTHDSTTVVLHAEPKMQR